MKLLSKLVKVLVPLGVGGFLLAACTSTVLEADTDDGAAPDSAKMSAEELAEHLIFNTNGFKLSQPVQEGGEAKQRFVQDETQKLCTPLRGERAAGETAAKVSAMARESIVYPEGGVKLGNWEIGRELAWSGYGYRVGHRNDDHSTRANGPGGNCYNCHQLATDRTGGTIGPSLTGYGKQRGTSEEALKFAYEMIYNPNVYFACTNMPRFGAKNLLTNEQISHLLAYLFDPNSPVNQ